MRSSLSSMSKSRPPSAPCRKKSPRVARRSSQNWKHSCRRGETRQIRWMNRLCRRRSETHLTSWHRPWMRCWRACSLWKRWCRLSAEIALHLSTVFYRNHLLTKGSPSNWCRFFVRLRRWNRRIAKAMWKIEDEKKWGKDVPRWWCWIYQRFLYFCWRLKEQKSIWFNFS